MARCGNHGIIIPRDKRLLSHLYWRDNHSFIEIAAMFDVTHRSVSKVFAQLGIATRGRRNKRSKRHSRPCLECGGKVKKILHRKLGVHYGRRCAECLRRYKAAWAARNVRTEKGRQRRKRLHDRWYYQGPLNPQGELSWISKGRAMLRGAKRLLAASNLEASPSRKRVFIPEHNSLG